VKYIELLWLAYAAFPVLFYIMENYFVIFQWHKKALVAGAHYGRKIDIAEISVYGMIRKEIISPGNIIFINVNNRKKVCYAI